MMKQLVTHTIFVALLIGTAPAFAGMVTETWMADVTSSSVSAFLPGDTISWTVTYDNSSTEIHRYHDGPNGVAEAGNGDDTLDVIDGIDLCPACTIWADAVFDFGDIFTNLLDGNSPYDNNNNNYAFIEASPDFGVIQRYKADSEYFDAYTDFPDSRFLVTYSDQFGHFLDVDNVRMQVSEVPLPTAAWLFISALLGLGMVKRRKA